MTRRATHRKAHAERGCTAFYITVKTKEGCGVWYREKFAMKDGLMWPRKSFDVSESSGSGA